MYILGLGEAWSRISWECGKWETQTPTYGYYSLCCTPEYYTYLAWIEQFYSKLLVWLTDWLGMLRFVMDRRTRRALRLLSPLGTHTCYHSIHLTQISPLINSLKTISINCGQFTKKGVGHCSVDSLIRLATLPPQVGTTRREEGEGAGAAGPEVKIIIIVQIIQM